MSDFNPSQESGQWGHLSPLEMEEGQDLEVEPGPPGMEAEDRAAEGLIVDEFGHGLAGIRAPADVSLHQLHSLLAPVRSAISAASSAARRFAARLALVAPDTTEEGEDSRPALPGVGTDSDGEAEGADTPAPAAAAVDDASPWHLGEGARSSSLGRGRWAHAARPRAVCPLSLRGQQQPAGPPSCHRL